MTDQATPGAAAPVAQPGGVAAAVAELQTLRAKTPGVRFNGLPPSVSALLDAAAPADGAAAPADGAAAPAQAGASTGAPEGTGTPADTATGQDPNATAETATAADVAAYAGDNAPMNDIDAMQARVGLAHRLQVGDEVPGLDPGVANEYGKLLESGLRNPPTRAQKLQAMAETARTMQWRYPNGQHEKVLADAQAELKLSAARIPELPGWLERTGGGNDIGIILRLAERHTQRAAARITSAARRR